MTTQYNCFLITGGRGARSKIDIVDGGDTLYDGGEALGECEGFEMSRSQVFIGKYKMIICQFFSFYTRLYRKTTRHL